MATQITDVDSLQLMSPERWASKVFSNGWRSTGIAADVVSPATGESLGAIGMGAASHVQEASSVARGAQLQWAALHYEDRAQTLRKAAQVAERHRQEIVSWLVSESGSVPAKAEFEVAVTIKSLWEASSMASQAPGLVLPASAGRISLARRKPIGVVGVISPFNFPLYLAMRAIAPALAVGNAVVLKPDPRTAVCGGVTIARIFEIAGLPSGVFHMLPGGRDAGEALCSDPHVGMIQFTGSTGAGRAVGELAGRNLKKVSLELGGKNSLIVLDDANLDLAVKNALWSVFLHQGQICMSAGRVLVQRGIAEEFSDRLASRAKELRVGNPEVEGIALGPLINQQQVDHVTRVVEASVQEGASLLAGGRANGLFYEPTVLLGVQPSMTAFQEEIFGPVASISVFDEDADAVRLANDTEFGLSAAVISNSVGRALKIGEELRVGLLHINDQTVNDDVVNPFGGVGASGNGTSIGGPANWEEFTQWQWVTIKDAPPAYPL